MRDPIERQDAIDAVKYGALSAAMVYGRTDAGSTALSETVKAIKAIPSAQPEIIRCKDCKHKPTPDEDGDPEFPTNRCPCQCDDFYYSWIPKDDWFCGNAERREE